MMILTADALAERYGLLPSEVLSRASTLDLYVMDAAITYRDYQQKKANKEYVPELTQEEMMAMLNKTRENRGG